jgi:hypothetical protein
MIGQQRIVLSPVARVIGGRPEMFEDHWYDVKAVIRLDDRFEPSALQGLPPQPALGVPAGGDRRALDAARRMVNLGAVMIR